MSGGSRVEGGAMGGVFTLYVHSEPSAGQVTECARSATAGKEDRAITETGGLYQRAHQPLIKKTEAKKAALHPEQQK